jgi:hypothetical protein
VFGRRLDDQDELFALLAAVRRLAKYIRRYTVQNDIAPAAQKMAMSPLELDGYLTGIVVTPQAVLSMFATDRTNSSCASSGQEATRSKRISRPCFVILNSIAHPSSFQYGQGVDEAGSPQHRFAPRGFTKQTQFSSAPIYSDRSPVPAEFRVDPEMGGAARFN